jgi:transposase
MVKAVANKILPIDVKNLQKLGIDEISLVKGQGKFIVVLVDLSTQKLIGLVADRKQVAIEKKMLEWGEEVLNQIEEVSMDRVHLTLANTSNRKLTVEIGTAKSKDRGNVLHIPPGPRYFYP